MAATLVLTGVTGPGDDLSAVTFTQVLWFSIDPVNNIVSFQRFGETQTQTVTVNAATTITATKSGSTWYMAIS